MSIPDGISIVLLTLGIFVAFSSAVGVLRMPDFFTRIHPAGKNDTLAQFLVVLALIVQAAQGGQLQVGFKLCWISLFLLLTTPSSTYAIARAAHLDGREPWRLPPDQAKPPGPAQGAVDPAHARGEGSTARVSNILVACLLVLVATTALAVVRIRNLFAASILLGIYSLLMALTWQVMQALDVAFTEAAVGAGISTILLIAALVHTGSEEKVDRKLHLPAMLVVAATGAVLLYGTLDMPRLGKRDAPVHRRAAAFYMSKESKQATHSPNIVTAVLASYRGFDTLFETAVIFTAGAGLVLLLRSPAAAEATPEDKSDSDGEAAA